jgi:hypothetical protein
MKTNANRAFLRRIIYSVAITFSLLVACVTSTTSVAKGATEGWTNKDLHVVGGPVVAGNELLVLNVSAKRQLELSGVNPSNGVVQWSHPFSPSQITLGAAFTPIAIGSTVLDFAPATSLSNPVVNVEGIDTVSGKVIWKIKQPLDISDAPVVCAGGQFFCFPTFVGETKTDLVAISPSTGSVEGTVVGPYRDVGVDTPGEPASSNLWQTDAPNPTLLQTSNTGQRVWVRTITSLFGGAQYSPNYGYDFLSAGNLDYGTVGIAPQGKSEDLSKQKSIGINALTGAVTWTSSGSVFCTGSLQFLTTPLVCNYAGSVTLNGTSNPSLKGVALTLTGINIHTGESTWSAKVADVKQLSIGTGVAFSDESHVVIETPANKWMLLDAADGSVSTISPGESFWCEDTPEFKVIAIEGVADSGTRVSEPVFNACSDKGVSASKVPSTNPNTVGVVIDGRFVWPSSHGLKALGANR